MLDAFRSMCSVVLTCLVCVTALLPASVLSAEPVEPISYNRDIRPILADHCFQCHGPDSAQRKAGLRLDTSVGATADLGGRSAIVPNKRDQSELVNRIASTDPNELMPPAETGKPLSAHQIELLKRWIDQGAKYEKHWSFIAPTLPTIPDVKAKAWIRNPIDAFVLEKLEQQGLAPSPPADPATLLRRVTLDLTGIPPTPEEVDAFLADPSDAAYERIVDRLLQTERHAERMAVRWLDGARYADTSGYQSDGERFMWRWRDWVLEAYLNNKPFDQFTVEQLAGDLLPGASLDQKIATGFNRNHRGNGEGGIIPEEYAVEYVVDRVETTYTVWLGLTMGCARCHDHKFDPLSQREFYQSYAFFNNIPEYGRAWKYGNSPPAIPSPTRAQQTDLDRANERVARSEQEWQAQEKQLLDLQRTWEKQADSRVPNGWTITRDLVGHWHLDGTLFPADDSPNKRIEPRPALAGATTTAAVITTTGTALPSLDPQAVGGPIPFRSGVRGECLELDGTRFASVGDYANFGFYDKFSFSAWVYPTSEKGGTILSRMTDAEQGDGWSLVLKEGKLQLNLVKRWLDDALRVETVAELKVGQWQHIIASYDGSRMASGVTFSIDGRQVATKANLDLLNQTFASKEPLRIGGGHGPSGRFHGAIDDVRIYQSVLTPAEAEILSNPVSVSEILAIPESNRSPGEHTKLMACYLETQAPIEVRNAYLDWLTAIRERDELIESFPTTMVMQELPTPKPAHILLRGVYDRPGEPVNRDIPQTIGGYPTDAPRDRLGFARWLVDRQNPLTARVAVNRLWQQMFGQGLVKTVDDFGLQGDWPSHPALLDWLAVEFASAPEENSSIRQQVPKRHAWDVRALLRAIVTSATYGQSSRTSSELIQRDPENRLLSRGPRIRLAAEMVRDQALAAAGLLVENLGGPSVKPYQPDGLWKELSDIEYVQDHGGSLYRRGIYTFWKRTVAPPTMVTFDAAGRETCIVRETRTNTPLQALTLMNETSFVEAARVLGERTLKQGGTSDAERIRFAFRRVLGRAPREKELHVLQASLGRFRARYRNDASLARSLISVGEFPHDETLDPAEHAAYSALSGLILNLDEAVSRE